MKAERAYGSRIPYARMRACPYYRMTYEAKRVKRHTHAAGNWSKRTKIRYQEAYTRGNGEGTYEAKRVKRHTHAAGNWSEGTKIRYQEAYTGGNGEG